MKLLTDFFKHSWNFFFAYKEVPTQCWKCKKPMVIKVKLPAAVDLKSHRCVTASMACRCGEVTQVSYYINTTGPSFGRKMGD